jgi:malate dehydrogenase (oxaloacetate-decarboxylating)(NADP+)
MDPRLLPLVARAVSQAAIDSGVAKIITLPTEYQV